MSGPKATVPSSSPGRCPGSPPPSSGPRPTYTPSWATAWSYRVRGLRARRIRQPAGRHDRRLRPRPGRGAVGSLRRHQLYTNIIVLGVLLVTLIILPNGMFERPACPNRLSWPASRPRPRCAGGDVAALGPILAIVLLVVVLMPPAAGINEFWQLADRLDGLVRASRLRCQPELRLRRRAGARPGRGVRAGAYLTGWLMTNGVNDFLVCVLASAVAAPSSAWSSDCPGLRIGGWALAMTSFSSSS